MDTIMYNELVSSFLFIRLTSGGNEEEICSGSERH